MCCKCLRDDNIKILGDGVTCWRVFWSFLLCFWPGYYLVLAQLFCFPWFSTSTETASPSQAFVIACAVSQPFLSGLPPLEQVAFAARWFQRWVDLFLPCSSSPAAADCLCVGLKDVLFPEWAQCVLTGGEPVMFGLGCWLLFSDFFQEHGTC